MKEKIILGVSLLVGIAALLLTTHFLKGKEAELQKKIEEIYAGAKKIKVVAAATRIPGGTVITKKDLALKDVFESSVSSHVITAENYRHILGKKTLFPLERGNVISWSFIDGGLPNTGGLSTLITPGLRAISIPVSGASAVSGMVQPKDNVDVLGTFSFPSKDTPGEMETVTISVLQDVTVLATGQNTARIQTARGPSSGYRKSGYSTVTLEVTPREAELLVFAQQMKGSLTLSLRHPSDVSWKREIPSVDFNLLQNELPQLNLDRQRNIRHKKGI
jgi:pilus assembly protein CpaB